MSVHEVPPDKNKIESFFDALKEELPAVFDRNTACQKLGGLLTTKTLANADAAGAGPMIRVKIGKKIVYERDSFIEWLKSKIR